MINWKQVQRALKDKGFDPGPIDGIKGPKTTKALIDFKRSAGLWPRDYVGPITLQKLGINNEYEHKNVPWLAVANEVMNLHEKRDNKRLRDWLRSDGPTLGDPAKLPWCGDFVDTAISRALPLEPRPGPLGINPYLARNWRFFGEPLPKDNPAFGAIAVFWRGRRNGTSGHVGFVVGIDRQNNRILVRGGNQRNAANDVWLSGERLLDYRWPSTYNGPKLPVPEYDASGQPISTNEA